LYKTNNEERFLHKIIWNQYRKKC